MKSKLLAYLLVFCCTTVSLSAQHNKLAVFGYFAGRATMIDSFPVEKLTHLCFSFTHLKGNKMALMNARDSASLIRCVAQKKRNPHLKVIVSIGGWTGCFTCSEVFSTDSTRKQFASSAKQLLHDFDADGIDLDWEYPTIKGAPGHPYSPNDKDHFTQLIQTLRDSLGKQKEISFAAGGFTKYLNEAVDWKAVAPLVDRINLMTYDLITGYDTVTGHHTALYPTPQQPESCDNAVKMLLAKKVPARKLLIGAAFYARIWENVAPDNNGLRGNGKFYRGISYSGFNRYLSTDSGFVYHWDTATAAPYMYNANKKWFVTFDDSTSIALKTNYAIQHKLNGIMFWQLADDRFTNGLLDVIDEVRRKKR